MITKPSTYLGKICDKHPEMNGKRRTKTGGCMSCQRDNRKRMEARISEKFSPVSREAIKERRDELLAEGIPVKSAWHLAQAELNTARRTAIMFYKDDLEKERNEAATAARNAKIESLLAKNRAVKS